MSLFLTSFIFEKKSTTKSFINWMAGLSAIRSLLMAILGWKAIPMPLAEEWLIIITGRPANQWSY